MHPMAEPLKGFRQLLPIPYPPIVPLFPSLHLLNFCGRKFLLSDFYEKVTKTKTDIF